MIKIGAATRSPHVTTIFNLFLKYTEKWKVTQVQSAVATGYTQFQADADYIHTSFLDLVPKTRGFASSVTLAPFPRHLLKEM